MLIFFSVHKKANIDPWDLIYTSFLDVNLLLGRDGERFSLGVGQERERDRGGKT